MADDMPPKSRDVGQSELIRQDQCHDLGEHVHVHSRTDSDLT